MIYDCFTFFNELDLLEIRLNILNEVVDKFVLVEATRTYKNKPKELYYENNKERFKQFEDKIIHLVLNDFPADEQLEAWTIENLQRNYIMEGLKKCQDDDIIMISDLDEIPRPELIKKVYNLNKIVAFDLDVYTYFLNNYTVGLNWTHGTKLLSYKNCKSILNNTSNKKYGIVPDVNFGTTPTLIRLYYGNKQKHIKHAGWHFSYIGGVDALITKYSAILEGDKDISTKEEGVKLINSKKFLDKYYLMPVCIDETFPEYIRDNKTKFADLIISNNCEKFTIFKNLQYSLLYAVNNIFAIRQESRLGIKRTTLIILGLKMRIKKEVIKNEK